MCLTPRDRPSHVASLNKSVRDRKNSPLYPSSLDTQFRDNPIFPRFLARQTLSEVVCSDRKWQTGMVFDHSAATCSNCGLVPYETSELVVGSIPTMSDREINASTVSRRLGLDATIKFFLLGNYGTSSWFSWDILLGISVSVRQGDQFFCALLISLLNVLQDIMYGCAGTSHNGVVYSPWPTLRNCMGN
ncbi:hypothetical protein TorRG33x02_173190 [Trema orientale]|uniref:Uncharacterized protein n=1 Tax=Trema orientale TaxID=63057 RepID=A0A2P5EN91_TREOI|nr:hypothetical protein TorRG33x02_173190 [Trema orientale]